MPAPTAPSRRSRRSGPTSASPIDQWLAHPAGLGSVPDDGSTAPRSRSSAPASPAIVAAYELMRIGLKPVVHEAARMGGRLRSQRFGGADDVIAELGGMRFPMSSTAFFHYLDLVGLDTAPFPNPLTPAAPTTVIDLAGVSRTTRAPSTTCPPLFREVADAWASCARGARGSLGASRRRCAPATRRPCSGCGPSWSQCGTTAPSTTSSPSSTAFSSLSYRHREVFGQVGFGTGGWDSDFPNSMLEILRVVLCDFDDDQRLVVGGAEQICPAACGTTAPDGIAHWPAGTSLSHRCTAGAPAPGVAGDPPCRRRDLRGHRPTTTSRPLPRRCSCTTQSWLLTTDIDVEESLFSHPLWMALDRTRYMQSSKTFVMVDRPFWNDIDPATGGRSWA